MIVLENVTKRYDKQEVLKGITFSVRPNEFVCITGPSGAGKTTLMHMLMGAESFDSGSVNIDSVDLQHIPKRALQIYRRRLGIVFQDYKLLWNRTVRENIAFPLEVCGAKTSVVKARTEEVLKQMNLERQGDILCHALSGGEKARTAIGRAIAHKPMIILADEPTGNLDPKESMKIMRLFKEIHESGVTIIIATHDTMIVDALRTRVLRIDNGQIIRDSVGSYNAETPEKDESKNRIPSEQKKNNGNGNVKIVSISS